MFVLGGNKTLSPSRLFKIQVAKLFEVDQQPAEIDRIEATLGVKTGVKTSPPTIGGIGGETHPPICKKNMRKSKWIIFGNLKIL